jgi:hypothetical protein
MATIINRPTQQELIKLVNLSKLNVMTPFTKIFTKRNKPIISRSDNPLLEDLIRINYESKTFPRHTKAPTLQKQGHMRLALKPDLLGGTMPVDSLTYSEKQAGEAIVVVEGEIVSQVNYEIDSRIAELKIGVVNALEAMASEVFLTSAISYLNLDFDPTDISEKGDLTVDPANGETVLDGILKEVLKFQAENKMLPDIYIGVNIFSDISQEINAAAGKLNRGDYTVKTVKNANEEYFEVEVATMGLTMRLIQNAKEYQGQLINTDDKIILAHPATVGIVYASLAMPNATNTAPIPVFAEYVAYLGGFNTGTLTSDITVHSSPCPFIMDNNLLWRFNYVKTTS